MKKNVLILPLIIRRLIEVLVVETAISAFATVLNFAGVYTNNKRVFLVSLAATLIYLIWTVYCLCSFRSNIHGKRLYFAVNLPIYAVLFAGAIALGCFDFEPIYTYLFLPFKVFHFAAKCWVFPGSGRLSRPVSAALTSAVLAIPVVLVPFILSTKLKMKMRGLPIKKETIEKETKEKENDEAQR